LYALIGGCAGMPTTGVVSTAIDRSGLDRIDQAEL